MERSIFQGEVSNEAHSVLLFSKYGFDRKHCLLCRDSCYFGIDMARFRVGNSIVLTAEKGAYNGVGRREGMGGNIQDRLDFNSHLLIVHHSNNVCICIKTPTIFDSEASHVYQISGTLL